MTESAMVSPGQHEVPRRTIGISPGDLVDAVTREIDAILKDVGGDRLKAVKVGIRRMHGARLIADSDVDRLNTVCDAVFAASAGKRSPAETVQQLDDIYGEMVLDPGSSELATTMVGVAYSTRQEQNMATLGLFGMVTGGLVGAAVGNAAVEAAVGGIVGGWVGARCEDDGD